MIKEAYKKIISKMPYVRELKAQLEEWRSMMAFPPGHYYSPIIDNKSLDPDLLQYERNKEKLYEGLDLYEPNQKKLLDQFCEYYRELPFPEKKTSQFRYYFENSFYTYSDAIFLYFIIRHFKPSKVIEIGSGFSSALMLDVNDKYFDGRINMRFIEPYPERLLQLIAANESHFLVQKKIQEVDLSVFEELKENDVLFVDSSHVVKTGHDLNYILFQILPRLKPGVLIHFHDIFSGFEYPSSWITEKCFNWNEIYFLKAFLMYNSAFEIVLFNDFLQQKYPEWFKTNMPLCLNSSSTVYGSIWIRRKLS